MQEFKYPMWFKSTNSKMVVKFTALTEGEVVVPDLEKDEEADIGFLSDLWAEHTDTKHWLDVTHLYQETVSDEKTSIPPLKKCEHGIAFDGHISCSICYEERKNIPFNFEIKEENSNKTEIPSLELCGTPKSAMDIQVGGNHYKKMKIQPMEYSMANNLDAMQHTIIKYVSRFRDKNGIEDLKKAKHTIDMLIEWEQNNVEA